MNEKLMEELEQSLDNSNLIWYKWNIPDNTVAFNPLKVTILGYDVKDYSGEKYQAFTSLIHEEDYERTMQAMRDHLEGRADIYRIDYRIKAKDGHYEWYMDRGAVIETAKDGKPFRLRGLVIDLGKEISADIQEQHVLKMLRTILPVCSDEKFLIVCANCLSLKISGNEWVKAKRTIGDSVGSSISHTICPACAKLLYSEYL